MKPRALIIVENAPFDLDHRVRHEADALRAAGWEVTVICPDDVGGDSGGRSRRGVSLSTFPAAPTLPGVSGYLIEYAWSLAMITGRAAAAAGRGVDVVQICNPPDVLFVPALLVHAVCGASVIFDQHDLTPELFAAKFGSSRPLQWMLRSCERLSYAAADVVLSTNESYRARALSRGGKRERDVYVVRNGPDDDLLSAAHFRSPRSKGPFVVGYVGMMGDQDGLDVLVRVAAHVVRDLGRDDVRFLAIGDGPARPLAQRLARRLGVDRQMDFVGILRGQAMYEALSGTDVCVAPDPQTAYSDRSTMIKVMEYMALGIPVVQFDLTEGRRTAADASEYAVPNDPRDMARRVAELLDDPGRREIMASAGRERAASMLAWSGQIPSLLAAYADARRRRAHRRGPRGLATIMRLWAAR